MAEISKYLPFLIPFAVIQYGLAIAAIIHILTHKTYRTGTRALWLILSIFVNIIGPVLYFCLGRCDEGEA